jgi:hypothetical protein
VIARQSSRRSSILLVQVLLLRVRDPEFGSVLRVVVAYHWPIHSLVGCWNVAVADLHLPFL